jgi:NAD(P)-dependent dehydrogenase (short-subunit alcohol dehydrogenase family)
MAQDRVAFITGGASGIGAACLRHFCAQGWDVAINYFSAARKSAAEELVALAEGNGRAGMAIQGDVSCDEDCRRMASAIAARFGRLDALISSAGTTRIVPHRDLDGLAAEDFLRATAVNTIGAFQIARACAPLLAQSDGGAVVIVSSYGAIYGTGSSMAYAASKGAVNTLTMSLARVLAPKIRVNAVCPALVDDGLVKRLNPDLFEARAKHQAARAPLQKIAQPAEVAADIYWLAAGTTLMTGNIISLDCGLHLNGDA